MPTKGPWCPCRREPCAAPSPLLYSTLLYSTPLLLCPSTPRRPLSCGTPIPGATTPRAGAALLRFLRDGRAVLHRAGHRCRPPLQVQGLQGVGHLRAPAHPEPVQGLRRGSICDPVHECIGVAMSEVCARRGMQRCHRVCHRMPPAISVLKGQTRAPGMMEAMRSGREHHEHFR